MKRNRGGEDSGQTVKKENRVWIPERKWKMKTWTEHKYTGSA